MLSTKFRILAAIGTTSLALAAAGPASAADNAPTPDKPKMGCELRVPGGTVVWPHGSTLTVDMGDGSGKTTYRCDDGQWVKSGRTIGPSRPTGPATSVVTVRMLGP